MRVLLFCIVLLVVVKTRAQEGFAVVELFTSQGCSSCPAADKNLTALLKEANQNHKAVYGLSFHVDYWNYIGWKDPYSSKAYSERQRIYARSIGSQRVYTPQMIVNGEVEFVGSSRPKAVEAIHSALDEKPKYRLSIKEKSFMESTLTLKYISNVEPNGERLNIAVVERKTSNYVASGENHGKTLYHDNVVKAFEQIGFKKEGSFKIDLSQVDNDDASIILYVQNSELKVIAAYEVKLNEAQQ